MLNRSASLAMSTSVLKALPDNLDIKRHSSSTLYLFCQLVDQVHAACDELQNSQMLVLVLEYLLAIGNHMNRNWSERNVTSGFQVSSMEKVSQFMLLFQQADY